MQEQAEPASSGGSPPDYDKSGLEQDDRSMESLPTEPLQQELAKWRERVPKLAAALRERTQELEALRARMSAAPAVDGAPSSSGIKARDALIEELEAKLKAQSARHQDAQGQMHARDVEIAELKEELAEWRDKWRSATETLDQHTDQANARDGELNAARIERDELRSLIQHLEVRLREHELENTALRENVASLESRNEKLFETTEMANRQLETLGDNLELLRQQGKDKDAALAERDQRIEGLDVSGAQWEDRIRSRDQDLELLHGQLERKQKEIGELTEQAREAAEVAADRERQTSTLETTIAESEQKSLGLQQDLDLLHEQLESKRSEIVGLNEQLSQAADMATERDRQASTLEAGIAESEQKSLGLQQDLERLQGQLESRQKEVGNLNEQLGQAAGVADDAAAERDELRRQVETLETARGKLEEEAAVLHQQLGELADVQAAYDESRQTLEAHSAIQQSLEAALAEQAERHDALEQHAVAQDQEVSRLEACIADAQAANEAREGERRQLSEQVAQLQSRNDHLEAQLEERSSLVVGLEEESSQARDRTASLEAEIDRLTRAVEKAERHVGENAEHVAHVDSRLARQKQLMEDLEAEYAETQQALKDANNAHTRALNAKEDELISLREKLQRTNSDGQSSEAERSELEASGRKLEGELEVVRAALADRDIQLKTLRQQLEQTDSQQEDAKGMLQDRIVMLEEQLRSQSAAPSQAASSAGGGSGEVTDDSPARDELGAENELLQQEVQKLEGMVRDRTEQLNKLRWEQEMSLREPQTETDEKMLVVLNQQLSASRDDNRRLLEQVRELETQLAGTSVDGADDLSRIRGVGRKLVEQLHALGIRRFEQIAELTEQDLDDESHVLHGFRRRIVKDEWILQARELGG